MASKVAALLLLACAFSADAVGLRAAPAASLANSSAVAQHETMNLASRQFMEVDLGPFASAAEACDYCFGSFTKEGQPPAGPVAPFCVCMAYPAGGGKHNMFCATPPSAAGYIAKKNGCRCKAKDMEAMGKTTCAPIN